MKIFFKIFIAYQLTSASPLWAIGNENYLPSEKPVLAMNVFSQEARLRTELFESISLKYGFRLINGRFGGEYNNDQLAIKIQNGKTILMLGFKRTSESGDLQLDQYSMGPFLQFSKKWLLAIIQSLKIDGDQGDIAAMIEIALKNKTLDLVVLINDRTNDDVKFLGIATPN